MSPLVFAAAAATLYNSYPAFDRPGSRVEAVIDKGLIAELIVRCPVGSAIISYSKVERVYCGPQGKCSRDGEAVIRRSCR